MTEQQTKPKTRPKANATVRFLVDWGGPACFLLAYMVARHGPAHQAHDDALLTGTWALVVGSILSLGIGYAVERRVAPVPLFAGGAALVFGGLTLFFHDTLFLYLKPTVINLALAVIMFGALALGKNPLKSLFNGAVQMSERGWRRLTVRYAAYFVFVAALNIVVWQAAPEIWPYFRMPGLLILTVLFSISQVPSILKEAKALEAAAELEG